MKSEELLHPKYILDLYTDKDDLLFYLNTKFKSPSIELYVNAAGKIEGFLCVSFNGEIYTTLKKPASVEYHNEMPKEIDEQNLLLTARTGLYRITRDQLKNTERELFFLKVGFLASALFAAWMMVQHHQQRNTIEKLKTEISQLKK